MHRGRWRTVGPFVGDLHEATKRTKLFISDVEELVVGHDEDDLVEQESQRVHGLEGSEQAYDGVYDYGNRQAHQ